MTTDRLVLVGYKDYVDTPRFRNFWLRAKRLAQQVDIFFAIIPGVHAIRW